MFNVGDKVQYKSIEGYWLNGIVDAYYPDTETYIIDATVYDYRPQYVNRTADLLRPRA